MKNLRMMQLNRCSRIYHLGGYMVTMIVAIIFYGCSSEKKEPTDTPTSGEVNIVVDESFQQLFDTEIYTFQSLYQNAKVHALYLPENQAIQRLLNDSCKVIVLCRDLTSAEHKRFEQANIFPISTKIAEDAVAFVVNNENTDTTMTVEKIKSIFFLNLAPREQFLDGFVYILERNGLDAFDIRFEPLRIN